MKEEDRLFPALVAAALPQEGGPVGVMLAEHVAGRGHIGARRQALADGDGAALVHAVHAYAQLLSQPILKENRILYPLAERRLHDQDATLPASFVVEEEITGPGGHEAYPPMMEGLIKRYL